MRIAAQAVLFRMLSKFPNAKAQIVNDIVRYLDPSTNACHEEMKVEEEKENAFFQNIEWLEIPSLHAETTAASEK